LRPGGGVGRGQSAAPWRRFRGRSTAVLTCRCAPKSPLVWKCEHGFRLVSTSKRCGRLNPPDPRNPYRTELFWARSTPCASSHVDPPSRSQDAAHSVCATRAWGRPNFPDLPDSTDQERFFPQPNRSRESSCARRPRGQADSLRHHRGRSAALQQSCKARAERPTELRLLLGGTLTGRVGAEDGEPVSSAR